MTSGTGSISVSGLLGGIAGQIDTNALINSLMQAQAIPQKQLQNQLSVQQAILSTSQAINTKLTALQTAAQAITDPTAWTATSATSSVGSVVATSDGTALAGSTTFDVVKLAQAQVSTIAADPAGIVVSNPAGGITITDFNGTPHSVALTSGTAEDVAAAVNSAAVGVRAVVVSSTNGKLLQLTSSATGASNAFTTSGFDSAAQNVVTAQDAQISVGDPLAGGYSVTSSTNTFTGFIPGVTFTVSAPVSGATISVASDQKALSDKIAALVKAANAATAEISTDTGKGAILQGSFDVNRITQDLRGAVSNGTATGASLKTYGIDLDKNGVMSFDPTVFAAAYAKDPAGTKAAISGSFAQGLATTSGNAIAPISGSITQYITAATDQSSRLNKQIDAWNDRLANIQTTLQVKYTAMQSMLGKLQSQSTYLTNMLKSMQSGSSSNSN